MLLLVPWFNNSH